MSKPKTGGQRLPLAAPTISFKRELVALRMQRRVPAVEQHLTIGGRIEESVNTEIYEKREKRIHVLESRLRDLTGRAECDFTFAQLESRASRDFDRSR